MGDSRRFSIFAERIAKNFKGGSIGDIAGGKGYLRLALAEKGLTNVETWDKRKNRVPGKQRHQFFSYDLDVEYDCVVGMHPDEGTDHIIKYAGKHRIPAFVCPCCVKPSAVTFYGQNYECWLKHLIKLAEIERLTVQHIPMKFNGKNDLLIFRPQ